MGKTRGARKDRDNGCDETKLYLQEPCLERKIPETELNYITEIPEGLESREWLALHTIGFFEHINLIYGTVSEFCTTSSCPDMLGPGPRTYLWMDERGKKSRVSAPQYVDYVMTYIQKTVNDETMFPTKHGNEFPPNFDSIIKRVHRLLFHVVAHIYHSHFREVVLLGLHAHLNSLFAHVIEFNIQHNTIENKETEVLQDLIHALKIIPTENTIDKEKEKEEGGGGMTITTEEGDVGEGEKGAREKGEKKEEGKGEELNSTMDTSLSDSTTCVSVEISDNVSTAESSSTGVAVEGDAEKAVSDDPTQQTETQTTSS